MSVEQMKAEKVSVDDEKDTGSGTENTDTQVVESGKLTDLLLRADAKDVWYCVVGLITAVLSGANQPANLILFGEVLNSFNQSDEDNVQSMIELLAILYVVVAAQMFITQFLQTYCMTNLAAHQTKQIREDYFQSLVRQPVSFFDAQDQGALASSVMESTLIIQDGIGEKLALAVQFTCSFVFGLVVAMYYSWQLALVVCGIVPVMALLIGALAGILTTSTQEASVAYNSAGSIAQEALGSIRTVYGFNAEQGIVAKYVVKLKEAEAAGIKKWLATGVLTGIISMLMWLVYALGLWFGAKLIADEMENRSECQYTSNADGTLNDPDDDCISGGDVMTCFFAILFGGLQLGQAFPAITAITSAKVELGKILAISDRESDIDPSSDAGDTIPTSSLKAEITFHNVSFHYPARPDHMVYTDLNLTIEAGTTVALVGPSGCGKSSLVGLVERYYDVDTSNGAVGGAVTLDGRDIRDLNVRWLRSLIGYVGQEPVLFSGSIFENISYGNLEATREMVEKAAQQANAHDFVMGFPEGYDTMVGERGIQLSGGQKQRIAIARAIVRNPQILILDEATSALDTTSERIVQAALDSLLQHRRSTTIVIAHRLSTIRNADKIVVLEAGRVIQQGKHDELMGEKDSMYASLVNMQASALAEEEDISALPVVEEHTAETVKSAGAVVYANTNANANSSRGYAPMMVRTNCMDDSAGQEREERKGGDEEDEEEVGVEDAVDDIESGLAMVDIYSSNNESTKLKEQSNDSQLKLASKEQEGKEEEAEKEEPLDLDWVWELSKPERLYMVGGFIGAALVGAAFPVLGFFLAQMITVFFNTDPDEIRRESTQWAFVFIAVSATQLVGGFLSKYCFGVITERLAARVRERSFNKMLHLDVAWYDSPENTPGSLAQSLATDALHVKALAGERTATSLSQAVTLLVSLAVAFYQSWEMTLVLLAMLPIIGASFGLQASVVQGASGAAMAATNNAGNVASQALLNIRTIYAFGLEKITVQNFVSYLTEPMEQSIKKGAVTGAGMGFAQFVILGTAGLQWWVGYKLIEAGRLEFSQLLAVILTIMFGAVGLGQFAADASDKAEAMQAAKTITKLWNTEASIQLDHQPDASSSSGSGSRSSSLEAATTAVTGEISLRNVSFRYPARPDHSIYSGLNLTIEAGTTVALVGPSGCGKSSLVNLVERFYDVDPEPAGAVTLDGRDIRDLNVRWLRSLIGYVGQEPVLFSGSIFENISYGNLEATREMVETAAQQANAHDFVMGFPEGYDTMVGERGIQLSGGQKQRIAIARAIVRNPQILILDEATSALDTTSERTVQAALDSLLQHRRSTTIVIAHRLSTIRNADKIVVLMNGVVIEQGTHEELIVNESGHYREFIQNANR